MDLLAQLLTIWCSRAIKESLYVALSVQKHGAKHSPPAFRIFSKGLPEGNFKVSDRRRSDFVTVWGQLICFQNQVSEALGSSKDCQSMLRPMHVSFSRRLLWILVSHCFPVLLSSWVAFGLSDATSSYCGARRASKIT